MATASVKVLLIEDNDSHAALVRRHLKAVRDRRIELEWAQTLSAGIERLQRGGVDAVLLDLGLPDSPEPRQTLPTILKAAPQMPVVVLTTLDDIDMAIEAVKQGAQDDLVKTQVTPELLARSIGYAIERKRHQLELLRYAGELERSNQEFQHFAHVAAHELKSPLWSVSLACEILAEKHRDAFDDETRELITGTLGAVRQMTNLINDLLEFARVETRARPPQTVDMEQALRDAMTGLKVEIESSGAQITHDSLPTIRAEPIQIRQLLGNLISNAIKYCGESPPRIHISAADRPDAWLFSVRDEGIGIGPEYHERIFGIFERVHDRSKIGTGIGLAICKRVAERHGGRIWVESRPGEGSTFYFTVPHHLPQTIESTPVEETDSAQGQQGGGQAA